MLIADTLSRDCIPDKEVISEDRNYYEIFQVSSDFENIDPLEDLPVKSETLKNIIHCTNNCCNEKF